MCCFTGKVESVSDTRIFARLDGAGQVLVYAMAVDTKAENAMVLPLPTAREAGEKAVEFVSLEGHPGFFEDLDALFLAALGISGKRALSEAPLAVQKVGAFEASFVPSASDFGRLDPRFRLPPGIWRDAPDSLDFGFAVFQLAAGRRRVHPMALRFATRDPETLFFPTLHIHDGNVHELADFDHWLYAQAPEGLDWEISEKAVDPGISDRSRGLARSGLPVHRRRVRGTFPNHDIWVSPGGS